MNARPRPLAWIASIALALLLLTAANAEAARAKVVLVLDASGSMWGHLLDDRPKIAAAKEVIRGMLRDWDPEVDLGLTVYGHRRKGDCSDIEPIVPLGPVDAEAFLSKVEALQPKGKTPMTESVRRAAHELKYEEERATVILVSDGEETCDLDPCAIAGELEKTGVDFTAHAIGFDVVGETAKEQLRCIAEKTGGEYLVADDEAGLRDALAAVVQKSIDTPAPAPTETPEPTATPGAAGVRARAVLVAGGEAQSGVYWTVYGVKADLDGKREKVKVTGADEPTIELPPGRYVLEASKGDVRAEQEIVVEAGETTDVELSFAAGQVKLVAKLADEDASADAVYWRVYAAKMDLDGKRKQIAASGADEALFTLPAGRYVVEARKGDASAEKEIEVVAGEGERVEVSLGAGQVKAIGKLAASLDPADGMYWKVYAGKADLDGKRKHVATSGSDEPTFTLPAGKYLLEGTRGEAKATLEFEVTPGSAERLELVLGAGVLALHAKAEDGGTTLEKVYWKIFEAKTDLEGRRKQIAASGSAQPTLTLSAGQYVVRAEIRGGAAGEAEVEVRAGERTEGEVIVSASQ